MAADIIVLDNSINTRMLWPDSQTPENNTCVHLPAVSSNVV